MMVRLLVGLFVLGSAAMAYAFDACTAYNPSDGIVCTMIDGATQGVCNNNVCIRNYTIPGNAARTGTGTISSSGATVTGSGTAFTTELHVGDTLTASGQRVAINVITSNTSLTTDPALAPAVSAVAFTYTNPIVRWLNESGDTVAILDSRGLVAFGQAWANGPLTVIGPTETAVGTAGKSSSIQSGTGGPAGGSTAGGNGGPTNLTGGSGGSSSSAILTSGGGSAVVITGGMAGVNTGGGPVGPGGDVMVRGSSPVGVGVPGRAFLQGGGGLSGVFGDVAICDNGALASSYTAKIGANAAMTVNCVNGDITKIKNVPVAGMWNVNAFQQANAGGM